MASYPYIALLGGFPPFPLCAAGEGSNLTKGRGQYAILRQAHEHLKSSMTLIPILELWICNIQALTKRFIDVVTKSQYADLNIKNWPSSDA